MLCDILAQHYLTDAFGTVILIEATNDSTYGLPIMLTLITARFESSNLFE